MTTKQAKPNPLAVLDRDMEFLFTIRADGDANDESEDSHAAIAELVEAVRDGTFSQATLSNGQGGEITAIYSAKKTARLRAALAAFGEQP